MFNVLKNSFLTVGDHLDQFIAALPFPLVILNAHLRVIAASEDWLKEYQLSRGKVLEHALPEVLPELHAYLSDAIQRAFSGDVVHAALEDSLSEGVFSHVTLCPLKYEADSTDGLLVCIFGDNLQKEKQTRFQDQSSFMNVLFLNSQIGLNLCRMDGLWIESNPAFLKMIGYSQEEADGGLSYWQLTPDVYQVEEKEQLKSLEETGRYGPYEKEFIRKDGTLVPVRLNGFLVEYDGEQYIWSFIEDITEWRMLQEALDAERVKSIHSAKLATLGELAAGIAHEVNNPLAVIDGYLSKISILLDKDKLNISELRNMVNQMRSASSRASKIVLGLKKFAREGSGDEVSKTTVSVILDETLVLCQARLRDSGIELQVENQSKALIRVSVMEISQVLLNLVGNAIDALTECDTKQISINCYDDPVSCCVVIEVYDSGPGIPEEQLSKIFTPFFTTKEVGKGTGLGLSISKGLVGRYDGALDYEYKEGRSCFVIKIPMCGDKHE